MSDKYNGGPAFPNDPDVHLRSDAECAALQGMTLRDWFAGKAMQGLLAQSIGSAYTSPHSDAAAYAYAMADAMLEAREK